MLLAENQNHQPPLGNSGPLGGCFNESDFVSALHSLLEHRIKNGRTTKQCCQTTAVETMSV